MAGIYGASKQGPLTMHYTPNTPADAETMRDLAADRVAEAEASIARWQRIRDTRQAEYAQAIDAARTTGTTTR
jgi:hypothetical protein